MAVEESQPPDSQPSPDGSPQQHPEHPATCKVVDRQRAFAEVGPVLVLINGVIAAISGVYVTTSSVPVTVMAAGAGLLLAAPMVLRR